MASALPIMTTPLDKIMSAPAATDEETVAEVEVASDFKPDKRFWLVMISVMCSVFLSALDLSCIAIALPVIAVDLNGQDSFLWVGSAYALTSTAFVPWTGSLAAIFGRKPTILGGISLFAVGSAMCGSAKNMSVMIAGRSIAGIGGGAILCVAMIIITDLVPLARRGPYFGLIGSVWAIATTAGPPLSGALTTAGQWRWIFYLNLPIAGIAIVMVSIFLNVKKPETNFQQKLRLMDWYNIIFVGASSSVVLALTWGGTVHPWSSAPVLAPLIIGIAGLIFFVWVEQFSHNPTVPLVLLRHPTSLIGFLETFIQAIILITIAYYFAPLYFQAAKGRTAVVSGLYSLPMSFVVAPAAIACGIIVAKSGTYKTIHFVAWSWALVGLGLLSMIEPSSITAIWVIYPMIAGVGLGLLQSGVSFPVLAPLEPKHQPSAMAFLGFIRSFGQVIGIAVGGTIVQNYLHSHLPAEFVAKFPAGQQLAFAAIPSIPHLEEPLKSQVQLSFAHSLHAIIYFMLALSGVGLLICFGMKNIALSNKTDEKWGLEEKKKTDVESGSGRQSVESEKA